MRYLMKKTLCALILLVTSSTLIFSNEKIYSGSTEDPYQNVTDIESIKTYFLRRIANDVKPGDPSFVIDGYSPNMSSYPKGNFFLASDSSQLDEKFKDVAKKIKLRLVG